MNDPLGATRSALSRTAADHELAPLAGLVVVEHGNRLGAAVCGSLLAALGAEVYALESTGAQQDVARAARVLGKRSIALDVRAPHDDRAVRDVLARADIVIVSSDTTGMPQLDAQPQQIVCDVSAFGEHGPLAGHPYSDALVQAVSGLADTTGDPDGAPTLIGLPFCEVSAGAYAAAACLVALRVRRREGCGQRVGAALYDCGVTALSTFLPFHMIGKPVTRAGNGHSLAAPWNAYRAADGWVLICTATDDQWQRLCTLIDAATLTPAADFETNAQRVARRTQVDAAVSAWTAALNVQDCVARLSAIDIACGPILTLEHLRGEPNLAHRAMVYATLDPVSGRCVELPGNPLPFAVERQDAHTVPRPDEHRTRLPASRERHAPDSTRSSAAPDTAPLAGLRVVEIGQYTTAPLVSRQLGSLGAEVFKIEPPGGEGSRHWPPTQGDRGYFFVFSNSDKKSLQLDLRAADDRAAFEALLKTSDVLVENLKPGSLARLGFSADALAQINPRLVYCGISGFGARSAYPGRPAFDTVVQAMSGFMDVTRVDGVPMKAGISAADIMGGELALVAILAALELRERTGRGKALDISMQDAAVWATASLWNREPAAAPLIVRCSDGYVCVETSRERAERELKVAFDGERAVAHDTRSAVLAAAERASIAAAPVASLAEVVGHEQTRARELIVEKAGEDGRVWPLLNSPLRLERTPARVERPIGALGEANTELAALVARCGDRG